MATEEAGFELEFLESLTLYDDYFEYRGKSYRYERVNSIRFSATVRQHSINFIPSGKSYDVDLHLLFQDGFRLQIKPDKRLVNMKKRERFDAVLQASAILQKITFNQRVERYEKAMKTRGFVQFGSHQIARNGDLFRENEFKLNLNDEGVECKLGPFQMYCEGKNPGLKDRLKKMWRGASEIVDISTDRDCFLYVMNVYLRMTWPNNPPPKKEVSAEKVFKESLLILGAQLCKADGHVTRDEISIFKSYFGIDDESFPGAGKIFMNATRSTHNLTERARSIAGVLKEGREAREYILIGLFQVAAADGQIDESEVQIIRLVAEAFGFRDRDLDRMRAMFEEATRGEQGRGNEEPSESYGAVSVRMRYLRILGVEEGASLEEVKQAYKELARRHHPDLLRAQGVPVDDIHKAEEMLKTINTAYEWLCKNV